MQVIIPEDRLYDVMLKYVKLFYPTLTEPLHKKIKTGKGNSGYGSGLDDYTYFNTEYVDMDDKPWFIEYDDRHINSDTKWVVNDELEGLYNMFGEESFEMFFKKFLKIDLHNKGNKKNNWMLS